MNIKIGAKIKALRKRDDITQEQLAEILGVSNQAISRWESESGYPDIEYIKPIANFFNVTIDYLFDHDTEEKQRKIEDYCKQYYKYLQKKPLAYDEQIDLMRHALAEFPAEEKLLINLARALYWKWNSNRFCGISNEDNSPDIEKRKSFGSMEEAMKIMEELLASSTDDVIRGNCRDMLASIYGAMGEKEKLLAVAEQCGSLHHSKEYILSKCLLGEDGIKNRQEFLGILPHITTNALMTFPDYADTDAEIEAYEFLIKFWKFIYRDDYGPWHSQLAVLYRAYASLLHETKPEEAAKAFKQAFAHAKTMEIYDGEEGEKTCTSPYTNRLKYSRLNFGQRGWVHDLYIAMTQDKYQALCENADFAALVKEVEAWVAEKG
ncbi:MAG: helix-turn-helix domain-containing protein [Oscillospiraceae bacterium]|nr:helix-turn-helix domain-containing protein [Oscillospiraceae bacterium]